MARIPPIDPDDVPESDRDLLRTRMSPESLDEAYRHLFSRTERNVHLTLANNPDLLETFRRTNAEVYDGAGLSKREREIVILTVAAETDSRYEWHQHVRHAMFAGFTPEEVRAIADGDPATFDEYETALHRYAAAFVRGTVDDATHAALADHVDEETLVGVAILASRYVGLAKVLEAFDVETEEPFVGWDLEGL